MVFDASTLILLAKIDLLGTVAKEHSIVITPIIQEEATRLTLEDSKLIARLVRERTIKVRGVGGASADIKRLQRDFHIASGEASSLWLAHMLQDTLATDDGRTIKAAKVLRVPFVTAVHFLIASYRRGEVSKDLASVKLEKLAKFGRYHPRIIEHARAQFDEGEKLDRERG